MQATAAKEAVTAANESAAATRRQNELLEAQLEASILPLLVLIRSFDLKSGVTSYFIENQGRGTAYAIKWWGGYDYPPKGTDIRIADCTVLGAGYKSPIDLHPDYWEKKGLIINCVDSNETGYINQVQPRGNVVLQQQVTAKSYADSRDLGTPNQ